MSNDAAREAAQWLTAAQQAQSPEQQQAAAAVSIAISLDRIADALGAGPRPNAAEKTYTGPVRVPTPAETAADRAMRVSSPYPRPGLLPDAHDAVRADADWLERSHARIAAGAEAQPNALEDPEMH